MDREQADRAVTELRALFAELGARGAVVRRVAWDTRSSHVDGRPVTVTDWGVEFRGIAR